MNDLWKLLLVLEIFPEDTIPTVREGVSSKTGKPFTLTTQRGYFKKPGSRFPVEFRFPLPDGQKAYAAGLYLVDPNSFDSDRFDGLELSRYDFALVPIPAEMQKLLDEAAKARLKAA